MELIIITVYACLVIYWFIYHFDKAGKLHKDEIVCATATCEDCKCEVKLENAYKVKYVLGHFYYCQSCKPNYDRVTLEYRNTDGVVDYVDCYYKELEVTKDGEPVGYKKK